MSEGGVCALCGESLAQQWGAHPPSLLVGCCGWWVFFFYINNIPGCMTTLSSLNYLNLLKNKGKFALKSMRESGKCQCENEEEQRLMHHLSCCFPVTALPGTWNRLCFLSRLCNLTPLSIACWGCGGWGWAGRSRNLFFISRKILCQKIETPEDWQLLSTAYCIQ